MERHTVAGEEILAHFDSELSPLNSLQRSGKRKNESAAQHLRLGERDLDALPVRSGWAAFNSRNAAAKPPPFRIAKAKAAPDKILKRHQQTQSGDPRQRLSQHTENPAKPIPSLALSLVPSASVASMTGQWPLRGATRRRGYGTAAAGRALPAIRRGRFGS